MPWKDLSHVDQRAALVADWRTGRHSVSGLAEAHGVSRKTAHKWIKRFGEEGRPGLEDRDRAPTERPTRTPDEVRALLTALRRERPRWGAPKIRAKLAERRPDLELPSERTVHTILVDAGLVVRSKRRAPAPRRAPVRLTEGRQPNDVWCVDFKGDFRLGDGIRCHPLTVTDHYSRYLLVCRGLSGESLPATRETLTRSFEEWGLPLVLRSDMGRPFCSRGPLGLTRLSVWLLKLGVMPEFTDPGRPDQNGRHERMHRTLKAETARPPRSSMKAQQRCFDRFRADYNQERPHQALGQVPPARRYAPSPRQFPRELPQPEYPGYYETRYVHPKGEISWRRQRICVGSALQGERVGLYEVEDGLWVVTFAGLRLGTVCERSSRAAFTPSWTR